jgi:hypothetical protein
MRAFPRCAREFLVRLGARHGRVRFPQLGLARQSVRANAGVALLAFLRVLLGCAPLGCRRTGDFRLVTCDFRLVTGDF